jgi:hypothetical protein
MRRLAGVVMVASGLAWWNAVFCGATPGPQVLHPKFKAGGLWIGATLEHAKQLKARPLVRKTGRDQWWHWSDPNLPTDAWFRDGRAVRVQARELTMNGVPCNLRKLLTWRKPDLKVLERAHSQSSPAVDVQVHSWEEPGCVVQVIGGAINPFCLSDPRVPYTRVDGRQLPNPGKLPEIIPREKRHSTYQTSQ